MREAFTALDEALDELPHNQPQELCAAVLARFAIGSGCAAGLMPGQ